MIAVIHQPNLFPRLKVLQKLALADVWIVLDDVQFAQREYQNRMMLIPNHGQAAPFWCTLPVKLPFGQATNINDVVLADNDSMKKVEKTILFSFIAGAEFKQDREELLKGLRLTGTDLVEFGIASTTGLLRLAGFEPMIIRSSSLHVSVANKSSRLVEICKRVDATTYISDSGGANYLEERSFHEAGIDLLWHVWRAPMGTRSQELAAYIRNGSGLNLLTRSRQEFIEAVANCFVSRQRCWSEGR